MSNDPRDNARKMAELAKSATELTIDFVLASRDAQRAPGEWPLIAPILSRIAAEMDCAATLLEKAHKDYTRFLDRAYKDMEES